MNSVDMLMQAERPYLTDGGIETWLIFEKGIEPPQFATILLAEDETARAAMRVYFDRFLQLAEKAGTGFMLDTNSWRGCVEWAPKLGLGADELLRLTGEAITFARQIRDDWSSRVSPIVLNGLIGPAGDGYSPETTPDGDAAHAMHRPQIEVLANGGVDMISALTMTNVGEAVGVVRAAAEYDLPVAIAFTTETDGRLPTGLTLGEAIQAVDAATDGRPLYYMVNCAHPDHFRDAISGGEAWVNRIGGLRANASRMSHAELDAAETLDDGDPAEFGALHTRLAALLPNLRVVGGCCGTDHRHIDCVSQHLHAKAAA